MRYIAVEILGNNSPSKSDILAIKNNFSEEEISNRISVRQYLFIIPEYCLINEQIVSSIIPTVE